jgi:Ca2+-binding RTX toxin-like protein
VIEAFGAGVDTVRSSVSHTLSANVENLVLTGSAVSGTGNALNNVVTGNGQANILNGGAGDDVLIGGDGVDRLTGGAGNDVFVAELNATLSATRHGAMSVDIIFDFDLNGDDKIDLRGIDADAMLDGFQSFSFAGQAAAKTAQITFQSFGNVAAAEAFLGMELDGLEDSTAYRPTTIVFGNTGGDHLPEFALVLLGTSGRDVGADDFTGLI